jgi:uroporphyrin-III C-methyltransferase/precorrin-2 dehydrogenase/sirohydrochlorin ferrochelatase
MPALRAKAQPIPIFVVPNGRPCLVAGGGEIALRKVEWLLRLGASAVVQAPKMHPEMLRLARRHPAQVRLKQGPFRAKSLKPYLLAIAATDDPAINRAVSRMAKRDGVPVNVVDRAPLCSFYVPATVVRGQMVVAVGSGGSSPALASHLRQRLERLLPESRLPWFKAQAGLRPFVLKACPHAACRQQVLGALARVNPPTSLRQASQAALLSHLKAKAGPLLMRAHLRNHPGQP